MSIKYTRAMAGAGLIFFLASCAMEGGGKLDWREDPANFSVDRTPQELMAQYTPSPNVVQRSWPGRLLASNTRR